jgi:hypothetical protein
MERDRDRFISPSGPLAFQVKKMKVNPFYSTLVRRVHHDNSACTEGNNIERRYRASGTGGLPRCQHCRNLG